MDEATRTDLLSELIDQMQENKRPHSDLDCLNVRFITQHGELVGEMDLPKALDCLFNNVYYFEDFDLRQAVAVELTTI